jgi:hypothetical protein
MSNGRTVELQTGHVARDMARIWTGQDRVAFEVSQDENKDIQKHSQCHKNLSPGSYHYEISLDFLPSVSQMS